jgi:hypothetical protein
VRLFFLSSSTRLLLFCARSDRVRESPVRLWTLGPFVSFRGRVRRARTLPYVHAGVPDPNLSFSPFFYHFPLATHTHAPSAPSFILFPPHYLYRRSAPLGAVATLPTQAALGSSLGLFSDSDIIPLSWVHSRPHASFAADGESSLSYLTRYLHSDSHPYFPLSDLLLRISPRRVALGIRTGYWGHTFWRAPRRLWHLALARSAACASPIVCRLHSETRCSAYVACLFHSHFHLYLFDPPSLRIDSFAAYAFGLTPAHIPASRWVYVLGPHFCAPSPQRLALARSAACAWVIVSSVHSLFSRACCLDQHVDEDS